MWADLNKEKETIKCINVFITTHQLTNIVI